MASEWAQLHPDLIEAIANRLTVYIDYIRFRAVCVSWRSAMPKFPNHHHHLPPQPPWLMVPSLGENWESQRRFFSLSENKYHLLDLPECSGKRVCGSSHGWLLMLEKSSAVNLFNPFTRTLIPLPPLTTFPHVKFRPSIIDEEFIVLDSSGDQYTRSFRDIHDFFIRKMVLSSSPSIEEGDDYMVVIILCFRELAFMKKGDRVWTLMNNSSEFEYEDVIFHKGRFYAVDVMGRVSICDFDCRPPKLTVVSQGAVTEAGSILYLVDCSGVLLLVSRTIEHEATGEYITRKFMVFKLSQNGQEWHWNEVKHLGHWVLFLGPNSSMSVLGNEFRSFRRNCIYFADNYSDWQDPNSIGGHDLGVFNLIDGSIKELPSNLRKYRLIWPPPTWVTPNPRLKLVRQVIHPPLNYLD